MAKTKKRSGRASAVGTALYVLLLAVWIVALFAIGMYIIRQVYNYASIYDDTQPEPVIEAYISSLRENLWDDSIGATVAAMPHQVQSDEEVNALVKEMLQNDLSYVINKRDSRGNRIVYDLLADGNTFGQVALEQDTSKNLAAGINLPSKFVGILAKMGVSIQPELYSWKVGQETFDFSGLYSGIRVTVPSSYRVSLNGVNLSEEYIVERDIHFDNLESYYYRYSGLPTKVTYEFDHIIGHIDPVIYDDSGKEFVIDETRDDSQFLQPVDDTTWAVLAQHIDGFANAYLWLSASIDGVDQSVPYREVLNYIEPGGELDFKLKQVLQIGNWSHNSYYQYLGSELTSAYLISDMCFLVEYTAHATVNQPAGVMDVVRNFRSIVDASSGRIVTATIDDI
ncbi:MAG: hypothetical protein K6C12_05360 [Oscillospiraceae bacterium]|nr:hypothetical protein [Oscillospiraceae bacterium]